MLNLMSSNAVQPVPAGASSELARAFNQPPGVVSASPQQPGGGGGGGAAAPLASPWLHTSRARMRDTSEELLAATEDLRRRRDSMLANLQAMSREISGAEGRGGGGGGGRRMYLVQRQHPHPPQRRSHQEQQQQQAAAPVKGPQQFESKWEIR